MVLTERTRGLPVLSNSVSRVSPQEFAKKRKKERKDEKDVSFLFLLCLYVYIFLYVYIYFFLICLISGFNSYIKIYVEYLTQLLFIIILFM